jgi:hypothetical protein
MMAPDPTDRDAYLEEQIARQKRGEPVDVEWVKAELERVRQAQSATMARTQRNLRVLVLVTVAVLIVLWIKNGGFSKPGALPIAGLILIGLLAVFAVGRRNKR